MSINTENAKRKQAEALSRSYQLGINASKSLELRQDAQSLAECIISYLETKNTKYVFTDFYDPYLIKQMRMLIKNKQEFINFLTNISFSINEFLEISAYVIPSVYTSHLIKFIRQEYLNLPPAVKTKKKSKVKENKKKDVELQNSDD